MLQIPQFASPLRTERWFNTPQQLTLTALRGKVVMIYAFQMLCPACVTLSIPQAKRLRQYFTNEDLEVIGLHSVFEHHSAMQAHALEAFLHEYRVSFPVAVDKASPTDDIPLTMAAYGLQGTPSLLVIDRQGRLQLNHFGHIDDLQLGAILGGLIAQPAVDPNLFCSPPAIGGDRGDEKNILCNEMACVIKN
jgi:peroxiredoxin